MALRKVGGAFETPNVMIVNSYRYTGYGLHESTKPQDKMQAVKEANRTECHWLKQRTEIWMNESGWSQRLRQKNEIQWSYEGMRGSGIKQYGRTNRANKQSTKHKLWRLKRIYSNSWVETTTWRRHLKQMTPGAEAARVSWCRARYLLNWGRRAGKRTNNKTSSQCMRSRKLNIHHG